MEHDVSQSIASLLCQNLEVHLDILKLNLFNLFKYILSSTCYVSNMKEKEKSLASNIINVQGSFKWMKKIYFIPLWISQIYEFVISFAWIIPLCFSVQRLILTLDPILYFRMFECERRFLISFDYWIQIDVNGNKMENRKRKNTLH